MVYLYTIASLLRAFKEYMWNPEVSLPNWFKINPLLKDRYPLICLCGLEKYDVKPFVTKNWIGIISEECVCGAGQTTAGIPRNENFNDKINQSIKNLVFNFL